MIPLIFLCSEQVKYIFDYSCLSSAPIWRVCSETVMPIPS